MGKTSRLALAHLLSEASFRFHVLLILYTGFLGDHGARLLDHSSCRCFAKFAQGRKVREFLASIWGLDGGTAMSSIYM